MSCWTKPELENMLEDVVNELDLSDSAIEEHGPNGTPPAELVRLVLDEKDKKIKMLQNGFPCCGSPGKEKCDQCQEIGSAHPHNQ
jgi:hypothetical protein